MSNKLLPYHSKYRYIEKLNVENKISQQQVFVTRRADGEAAMIVVGVAFHKVFTLLRMQL